MTARKRDVHIMIDALMAQNRLPRGVQDKSAKLIMQMKNDASGNGINFESIVGARDRHMKSARIDQSHRAIVYDRGGALVVMWVDKHDDAYAWARNRVVEVNPVTSAVQVTDMSLVEAPSEIRLPPHPHFNGTTPEPLFARVDDADFERLGLSTVLFSHRPWDPLRCRVRGSGQRHPGPMPTTPSFAYPQASRSTRPLRSWSVARASTSPRMTLLRPFVPRKVAGRSGSSRTTTNSNACSMSRWNSGASSCTLRSVASLSRLGMGRCSFVAVRVPARLSLPCTGRVTSPRQS